MSEFAFQKTNLQVVSSFAEADEADRLYWWNQTPEKRLRALQHLRELNYGDLARSKLQRVFEFVRIPER